MPDWNTPTPPPDDSGRDDTQSWGIHLAADIRTLADSALEEIMGAQGDEGHKAPRADIQKLKNIYELLRKKQVWEQGSGGAYGDIKDEEAREAQHEWDEKYGLSASEISTVGNYQMLVSRGFTPDKAFEQQTYAMAQGGGGFVGHEQDAKKFLGSALKKFEDQQSPRLYTSLKSALEQVHELAPESYKIWPWLVKQVKEDFKTHLLQDTPVNTYANKGWPGDPPPLSGINHIVDVVGPAGKAINELRQNNTLPQGFDLNEMSFKDLEEWFMEWKRENRGSLAQGEVVYKFHDGCTIQKLTEPEQLQYEGDEMRHCVGDYHRPVAEGTTIIYSLRDAKNNPHVTMEVEAIDGYQPGGPDDDDQAKNVHPDKHEPGQHFIQGTQDSTKTHPTFEIVQIMGKANNTPKPEYQHKITEWLDTLRAKGWRFEWSPDAHVPYDNPRQDHGESKPVDAETLHDWYDDHYKQHYKDYHGGEDHTDTYGIPAERQNAGGIDWDEMLKSIIYSLCENYDRGAWTGANPDDMAQAVYHAWVVDIYKDHLEGPALEQHKKELLSEIEKGEEQLNDQEMNYTDSYYHDADGHDEQYEHFMALAKAQGVWDQIEKEAEEEVGDEEGYYDVDDYQRAVINIAETQHEDLWYEARDKVNDEVLTSYSGRARRFFQYLYMLAEKHGLVSPRDLPDPNQTNGGLPGYTELSDMPWKSEGEALTLPGTLSSYGWSALS